MKIAIIGAGWSGLACALTAVPLGHEVTVFEASRHLGGRARAVQCRLGDGQFATLDNGQHILIGAYRETLGLMETVGVKLQSTLHRTPLTLAYPDGSGIAFGRLPPPLNAMGAILRARGWRLSDKLSLFRAAMAWRLAGFECADSATVDQLCGRVSPRVRLDLIEPLCISALNTPAERASGRVFLRVMKDSLFGGSGSSDLLLPLADLSSLFPDAAAAWLLARGARLQTGERVGQISATSTAGIWQVNGQNFDRVVMAADPSSAAALIPPSVPEALAWKRKADLLQFEAIATVYTHCPGAQLAKPMLALKNSGPESPAQFVFDRGQLGGAPGLFAFVVSASSLPRLECEALVLKQARLALGLDVVAVQTIVEKRATFACLPHMQRPGIRVAHALYACGDYIDGPYPATLEGAVRSGIAAANALNAV